MNLCREDDGGDGGGLEAARARGALAASWSRASAAVARGRNHGYNLLEALRQFGFIPGTVDTSVVYRVLRRWRLRAG